MMKRNILLVFLLVIISPIFAQKASDYLCLDSAQTNYYRFHTGDTLKLTFEKSFVYQGDTICYYTREFLGSERKQTIYFAYNGSTLIKGSYSINGLFTGINELDTKIEIVNAGQTSDTSYTKAFDMQSTDFTQSTRLIKKFKHANGNTYKKVIELDQYNTTNDFHYITLFAPGIGIISQGKREMELIKVLR